MIVHAEGKIVGAYCAQCERLVQFEDETQDEIVQALEHCPTCNALLYPIGLSTLYAYLDARTKAEARQAIAGTPWSTYVASKRAHTACKGRCKAPEPEGEK